MSTILTTRVQLLHKDRKPLRDQDVIIFYDSDEDPDTVKKILKTLKELGVEYEEAILPCG